MSNRIFIDTQWYIPIDDRGYCAGRYFEGALGCVIQLRRMDDGSNPGQEQYRALKIPRLRGDTVEENQYIDGLSQEEVGFAVRFAQQQLLLGKDGLEHPLRAMRSLSRGPDDMRAQHGQVVLVRFEKGHAPRFCSVGLRPSGPRELVALPAIAADELPSAEDVQRLIDAATTGQPFTHVTLSPAREARGTTFPLAQVIDDAARPSPWFCFVPSVVYHWAETTLQEAICEGKRGDHWGFEKHLALIRRILAAVDSLHAVGAIHADLRPANIMCRERPEEPEQYVLGDYGSLSFTRPAGAGPSGGTLLGPRVGTERSSPFYSPERRAAQERETSDTAIVLRRGDQILIMLGWNKSLILDRNVASTEKVLAMRDAKLEQIEPLGTFESLQDGDRVRLRDLVFTVEREGRLADNRVLVCRDSVYRICHGNLVVPDDAERFEDPVVLRIPSVVELQKWGASTDLYGIGALALYSVYCDSMPTGRDRIARAEIGFGEMVQHLESRAYFHTVWDELDAICEVLHNKAEACLTSASSNSVELTPAEMQKMERVTGGLTRTVPGLERIWRALEKNQPHFLLFVHFVMSCLHRQSHLRIERADDGDELAPNPSGNSTVAYLPVRVRGAGPFCKNRLEDPRLEGAAHGGLKRADKLRQFVGNNLFKLVRCAEQVPRYQDPLRDNRELKEQRDNLRTERDQKIAAAQKLADALDKLKPYVLQPPSTRDLQRTLNQLFEDLPAAIAEARRPPKPDPKTDFPVPATGAPENES